VGWKRLDFFVGRLVPWPSIVDILALVLPPILFRGGSRLERWLRILLLVSGLLSLAGLIGVPLADMQVRNIGVVGYAVVAPVAFSPYRHRVRALRNLCGKTPTEIVILAQQPNTGCIEDYGRIRTVLTPQDEEE